MTRLTGASESQIEAAVLRRESARNVRSANRIRTRAYISEQAEYLVDTDHRIVSVDDLQWLLQIAIATGLDAGGEESRNGELIERIAALIGDGADTPATGQEEA